jgi:hypothetical protein
MPNDWKMRKQDGGQTGDFLDNCEIRKSKDGTAYELIAVLATKSDDGKLPDTPFPFPVFAYRGLVWNITVDTFNYEGLDEAFGPWTNNAHRLSPIGEEDGTWTAQAGQGAESEGTEDAASASA